MGDAGGTQWTVIDQAGQVAGEAFPDSVLPLALEWARTQGPSTIIDPAGQRYEVLWMGPTAVPGPSERVTTTGPLAASSLELLRSLGSSSAPE